jgi:DsbC/DsbD-like thiol-disulfide interchange protein
MLFPLRRSISRIAAAAAILVPAYAHALESKWSDSGKSQVRLVVAGASAKEPQALRAGIEIRMLRGWHTYWRYAGDAGLPPRFDWSASENLERAKVLWPAPVRIAVEDGIESIGYKDTVLLPVRLYPQDPSKPVVVRMKLDYGVCEKICIPAAASLSITVPPGTGRSFPALDAAEARVPAKAKVGASGKLAVLSAKLERDKKPAIVVDVAVPEGRPFDLLAEGPSEDWALPLPKQASAANGRARFVIPLEDASAGSGPMPESVRLTLVSGSEAMEVDAKLD